MPISEESPMKKTVHRSLSTVHLSLRPVDLLIIWFAFFLSIIDIGNTEKIHQWGTLGSLNVLLCALILVLAKAAQSQNSGIMRVVFDWYPAPVIFLSFKEIYVIIQSLKLSDFDTFLILCDRKIFGTDPTVFLQRISTPVLTEILQLAYASYYIILLLVAFELYVTNRREEYSLYLFIILFGFFLSYLGYLMVPAIGPRFMLHDFNALDRELPGLWLTTPIRNFLDAGESIPHGVTNAYKYAQRDVFPSGHTEMTLLALYLATKFKLRTRKYLYVAGGLLIIATVYLRYHYVTDLIGGVVAMLFTAFTAPQLFKRWGGWQREVARMGER
jgi:membrane-associated phospholipid phosphatase